MATDECHGRQVRRPRRCDGPHAPSPLPHPRPGQPDPERILIGPAVTISYFPSCAAALDPEHYKFADLFYEAVGDDSAGKVIVLASNAYTDTSMGGGTKLRRLNQNGCAGVLTDGRLRDFDELARYDFALTARVRRRAGAATT
jgi:regulator of RNase E activity RraA